MEQTSKAKEGKNVSAGKAFRQPVSQNEPYNAAFTVRDCSRAVLYL